MTDPDASALPNTGPFLTMAVLCEKVMVEQDGNLSVIRITDTINRPGIGPDAPREMPSFVADSLTMIVVLRAGQAKGRFGIKVQPETPDGLRALPPFETGIQLVGGPWGASVVMPFGIEIEHEGVYWFDVSLTGPKQPDKLLTRVPLEVLYSPEGGMSAESR